MRRIFLLVGILIVGCSQANPPASSRATDSPAVVATAISSSAISSSNVTLSPPTQSGVQSSSSSSTVVSKTPTAVQAFPFQVTAPQDESIVTVSPVIIVGRTLPSAVVSVNGKLANVDATGNFQFTLALEDGANIIEIVASDINGNEQDLILSVVFEP